MLSNLNQPVTGSETRSISLFTILVNIWLLPVVIAYMLISIALFPPFFIVVKIATRWPNELVMQLLIRIFGNFFLVVCWPFIRIRHIGATKRRLFRPAILVMNHASFLDPFLFATLPIFRGTMCVRSWPFRMPWFRPFMHLAKYQNWESSPWEALVRDSSALLAGAGRLLAFPEGHRSRDGRLARFRSGVFRIAKQTGTPVIPICISGTLRILPPGRLFFRPGVITVSILDAVHPVDFPGSSGHRDMLKFVKNKIAEALRDQS